MKEKSVADILINACTKKQLEFYVKNIKHLLMITPLSLGLGGLSAHFFQDKNLPVALSFAAVSASSIATIIHAIINKIKSYKKSYLNYVIENAKRSIRETGEFNEKVHTQFCLDELKCDLFGLENVSLTKTAYELSKYAKSQNKNLFEIKQSEAQNILTKNTEMRLNIYKPKF